MSAEPSKLDAQAGASGGANSTESKPAVAGSPGVKKFQQSVSQRDDRSDDPEEELWRGGYSAKDMVGAWLLMGLATVVVLGAAVWADIALAPTFMNTAFWLALVGVIAVLWLALLVRLMLVKWSVDYRLTSQRLIHKKGILKRTTDRVEVIDMDDVAFQQGLLQRMMGVGDITIHSSDTSHPLFVLRGIDDVSEVAGKMDTARRKERVRRGIHVERI